MSRVSMERGPRRGWPAQREKKKHSSILLVSRWLGNSNQVDQSADNSTRNLEPLYALTVPRRQRPDSYRPWGQRTHITRRYSSSTAVCARLRMDPTLQSTPTHYGSVNVESTKHQRTVLFRNPNFPKDVTLLCISLSCLLGHGSEHRPESALPALESSRPDSQHAQARDILVGS